MEGLDGLGRPNAADRPDQRGARERSGVWRTVFAELWRRKRAAVYWSRLEQPEAGAEASFRPRSGRSDTRCRAAEGAARFGRPWTGKGCRPWSSPAEGRRMPPSNNEPDSRILRRLQEIRERGEAGISPLLIEGPDGVAARGWAKAGGVVPPGANRPIRARQPTHPATESRSKKGSSTLHNLTCVQTARGFNTRPL